jgi:hypothetical protein
MDGAAGTLDFKQISRNGPLLCEGFRPPKAWRSICGTTANCSFAFDGITPLIEPHLQML